MSIEIPDWVVRKAAEVMENWHNSPPSNQGYNDAMRSALTAALGAWVVPVGYQETITVQDDGVFADIEQKLWHWIPGRPIPESTADTFREPLYTLRQEKPE